MSRPVGPEKDIAARLREIRDVTGVSPSELALATGVEEAEVLAYETGDGEIPVSYLYKAAKACGVDLTALLTGREAHLGSYSLVRAGNGLNVDRRKAYDYLSLAYRFHKPAMEPFLITVPPTGRDDLSFNSHTGQEFIYVIDGRLEVLLGDDAVEMLPGDSLYFDSRTPHAMRGMDDAEARFLDVII